MYIYNADRLAQESNKSTGPLLPGDLFNPSTPKSALGRAKRGVNDRIQNKETKEAHALPHSLGLANFELVLPIKVIGMGVKCVDKISSLA